MRPRTATIQVSHLPFDNLWKVEIGHPGASTPTVIIQDESLEDALVLAVVAWQEKEGLGD